MEDAKLIHTEVLRTINEARGKTKNIDYADNVAMTKQQFDGLCERHGEQYVKDMIDKLSNYKYSTGKKYKSDYHTILNWISRTTDTLTCEKCIEFLKTNKDAIYEIYKLEREKIGEMPTLDAANMAIEMMGKYIEDGYSIIKVHNIQSGKYGIFKCKKTKL